MAIGLDFDGVIHRYSKGWNGGGIYDPPMDGAIEAVKEIMGREATFIFTARDVHDVFVALDGWGLPAMTDSPVTHRKFWNKKGVLLVTNKKYPARLYLDDRAVTFSPIGGWEQAMIDLGYRGDVPSVEAKIRELHQAVTYRGQDICGHCSGYGYGSCDNVPAEWPCDTIKLLG